MKKHTRERVTDRTGDIISITAHRCQLRGLRFNPAARVHFRLWAVVDWTENRSLPDWLLWMYLEINFESSICLEYCSHCGLNPPQIAYIQTWQSRVRHTYEWLTAMSMMSFWENGKTTKHWLAECMSVYLKVILTYDAINMLQARQPENRSTQITIKIHLYSRNLAKSAFVETKRVKYIICRRTGNRSKFRKNFFCNPSNSTTEGSITLL